MNVKLEQEDWLKLLNVKFEEKLDWITKWIIINWLWTTQQKSKKDKFK